MALERINKKLEKIREILQCEKLELADENLEYANIRTTLLKIKEIRRNSTKLLKWVEIPHNIRKIIKGTEPRWFQEMGEMIKDQENLNINDYELNPFTLKEIKKKDLQNEKWIMTKEGLIGRVKNIKNRRVTLSHWNIEGNIITE
ncbi:4934_t:CDS:2 [Gigaspora margarita]|uniref:4934_t:CDS:1 n=1 Tax=Gigaspora margarita TaxID=4874 RepID=A0ABN7US09_GIGMA|nr:4934_t:CDS:2 [Gigaspora margarita]